MGISTSNLDAGTDSPQLARAELLAAVQWINQQVFNVKDYGAVGNGSDDDTDAINDAIAAAAARTYKGGTIYFPAGTYKFISTLVITNTHGLRFLGDVPAYTPGFEGGITRLHYHGSGNAIELTGVIADQSAFILENIRLDNIGNPNTNKGIACSAGGFAGGLEVVGCVIKSFAYGVYTVNSPAFSYQRFRNSAFYYNATWGVACSGDNIVFETCAFSNNGPDYQTGGNAFEASPTGGGALLEQYCTNVMFNGANHVEGHRVGILVRDSFGVTISGVYFEAQSKCAVQAMDVVGLRISGNYHNPNSQAHAILLSNCAAVTVGNSGYGQEVYRIGLADYDLSGCTTHNIDTGLDRTVDDDDLLLRHRYDRVDVVDTGATDVASPTGGQLTNITGPTPQSAPGPFGTSVDRYVASAGGYFVTDYVAATSGQYIYFSALVRNVTQVTAVVRDTSETNPIVVQALDSYGKDWSVLTVGGKVPANANYRLSLVVTNGETFDLAGIVYYLGSYPMPNQAFSFTT